jgi:hypothetical protein
VKKYIAIKANEKSMIEVKKMGAKFDMDKEGVEEALA